MFVQYHWLIPYRMRPQMLDSAPSVVIRLGRMDFLARTAVRLRRSGSVIGPQGSTPRSWYYDHRSQRRAAYRRQGRIWRSGSSSAPDWDGQPRGMAARLDSELSRWASFAY